MANVALHLARYVDYQDNLYFLSLAVSRDVYNAIKCTPAAPIMKAESGRLKLQGNEENFVGECKSGASTGTSIGETGPYYRLSENVTFAEITNKLNFDFARNNGQFMQ